jgi:Ca2+-binding RTX toxin-like protein
LGSGADSITTADFSADRLTFSVNTGAGNDTVIGSSGADYVFGSEGDDVLSGNAGDDLLQGGAGSDRLTGGSGFDLFALSGDDGAGVDTITDWNATFDDLSLSGSIVSINAVDGDADGAADDVRLIVSGAASTGTLVLLNAGMTRAGTFFGDTLSGTTGNDAIAGLGGTDSLLGGLGDDSLYGGWGSDTLDGGAGNDLLDGGASAALDVVSYTTATGQIVLRLDLGYGGSAAVGFDSYVSIERFLLGSGADIVIGSTGADDVNGGAGNDWMDGGAGADSLAGGSGGNDILSGGAGDDALSGEAGDQFYGGADIDVANLSAMTAGITIDVANGYTASGGVFGAVVDIERFQLGSGNDLFVSFTGTRTVQLGGGNDWIADYSTGNNDVFFGDAGNDALYGLAGDDQLNGGGGVDLLVGGDGADTLIGGDSGDWMQGGAGSDVFRFVAVADSRTFSGIDAVSDFVRGSDLVDLAAIDANTTLAGDQGFTIGLLTAGQAGRLQITFEPTGSPAWALVQGDVDGNGTADIEILVFGNVAGLAATDFLL